MGLVTPALELRVGLVNEAETVDGGPAGACHCWVVGLAETIECVDCGGVCHRSPAGEPELGWRAGDVVSYRCRDCNDVWYLEVHEDDVGPGPGPDPGEPTYGDR